MSRDTPSKLTSALFFFYGLFIFGSTFSIAVAQMAFGVALALFVTVVIIERHQPFTPSLRRFYIFVALYVVWIFVSSVMGKTVGRSLFIMKEDWLFFIIPVGVHLMQSKTCRERLVTAFAAGVVLISIYSLLQYCFGLNWGKDTPLTPADGFGYRVRGSFSNRLTFGNYYATAALALLGLGIRKVDDLTTGHRRLFLIGSVLAMIVTILTFSRGSVVALVTGLLIAGLVLGRNYLIGIITGLVVVSAVVALTLPGLVGRFNKALDLELSAEYEGGRPFIWQKSLSIAREHPLFGVGPGNFAPEYEARLRPDIPDNRKLTHAHNDFINMVAVYGFPGFLFFTGLWLTVLAYQYGGFRRWGRTASENRYLLAAFLGSVTFLVSSMFEATFADEEVRQLLMFIWALGLWPWYNELPGQKKTARKTA